VFKFANLEKKKLDMNYNSSKTADATDYAKLVQWQVETEHGRAWICKGKCDV
jgi:hypothetical protein